MKEASIRSLTVCVDYDDLLEITLPRNARHLKEVVVVTTPEDTRTQDLVKSVPNARCFVTDAFHRNGARFNKGLAIEECFDYMGRYGWLLIWDADILFPARFTWPHLVKGCLYTPLRRNLDNPSEWTPRFDWSKAPISKDSEFAGYFQLFHADDPVLQKRPWYDVIYTHAGGGDSAFQNKWSKRHKVRPPLQVLHLGPRDANWFGRTTPRIDGEEVEGIREKRRLMEKFLHYKGWGRPRTVAQFKEFVE